MTLARGYIYIYCVHSYKSDPPVDARATLKSAKDSAASLGVKSATSIIDRTAPVQDINLNESDQPSDFEIFEARKKMVLLKAKRDKMLNDALNRTESDSDQSSLV